MGSGGRGVSICPATFGAPALDVCLWLAHRLHALRADRLVTWAALKGQFGGGFAKLYHFKNKFPTTLELALTVYPDAKVEATEQGVILKGTSNNVLVCRRAGCDDGGCAA